MDTAPLVAFVQGLLSNLGPAARRVVRLVESGKGVLGVPTICLFEVAQLEERGRIALGQSFGTWCDLVDETPGLRLLPLERIHVVEARALPGLRDPSDRLVAGVAVALGVPLVTPDARIAGEPRVRVLW